MCDLYLARLILFIIKIYIVSYKKLFYYCLIKFNFLNLAKTKTGTIHTIIIISSIIIFSSCDGIFPTQNKPPVPADHTDNISGAFHRPEPNNTDECTECHGEDLKGGLANIEGTLVYANSCYQCHNDVWNRNRGGGLIKNKILK